MTNSNQIHIKPCAFKSNLLRCVPKKWDSRNLEYLVQL